jgi:hypothetical protein
LERALRARETGFRETYKYIYEYIVQGNYGQGWEDVGAHTSRRDARAEKRTYDENESYPHRVIFRRTLRDAA